MVENIVIVDDGSWTSFCEVINQLIYILLLPIYRLYLLHP